MASASSSRPLIGFLAARYDEPYQHAVWCGAVEEARRLGLGIVFFSGRRLACPIGDEYLDNFAFELAAKGGLEGLLVMSNAIGSFLSPEGQADFLRRFPARALVTVGSEVPGLPLVSVDASGGMGELARHLVLEHGRRRLLFLSGPAGHPESEARRREFEESLRLLEGEALTWEVLVGDFTEEDAQGRLAERLRREPFPDAVAAANDLMAFGAMRALAERGLRVPEDVSVSGFDDTEECRFSSPPLTTVRQPIAELGRLAVARIAADLGLAPPAPPSARPRVEFVLRQSCGCPYSYGCPSPAPAGEDFPGGGEGPARGLETLVEEVDADVRAGVNPARHRSRSHPPGREESALLVIAEGEGRYLAQRRLEAERRLEVMGRLQSTLVSSFAIEDILRGVARGVRELGISGCWLCLFEGGSPESPWARLLLASEASGDRILAPYGLRFRVAELFPGGFPADRASYVLEPLRFGKDRLGYLLCTADSADGRMFEALRDQVSGAIKGAILMAAERDRERELEAKVRERTREFAEANDRLLSEAADRRRLQRELLDISNRIMGDIGRDIHDDLCQDIAGLGIMAAVLEGRLRRLGDEESAEAAAGLGRIAGETAAKAKVIARGLYPAELEAKGGLPAALERLVQASRRPEFELLFTCTPGFALGSPEKSLHLYRIAQEALSNALRHAKARRIHLSLSMDRETVAVEVADDGVGLPPSRSAESGMGLRIIRYRAGLIGGELRLRSLGPGTSLSCRVPR